jgi:hypothetical protein
MRHTPCLSVGSGVMRLLTAGLVSALLLAGCKSHVGLHVPLTGSDLSLTPQPSASLAGMQQFCPQSVAFGMTGAQRRVCPSEAAE